MEAKKKKHFLMLQSVKDFMRDQPGCVKQELNGIIYRLECLGTLSAPYTEKVENEIFAIRVIQTANIRVFYVYGIKDRIFGIHAYVKKTQEIPKKELKYAQKVLKILLREGVVK